MAEAAAPSNAPRGQGARRDWRRRGAQHVFHNRIYPLPRLVTLRRSNFARELHAKSPVVTDVPFRVPSCSSVLVCRGGGGTRQPRAAEEGADRRHDALREPRRRAAAPRDGAKPLWQPREGRQPKPRRQAESEIPVFATFAYLPIANIDPRKKRRGLGICSAEERCGVRCGLTVPLGTTSRTQPERLTEFGVDTFSLPGMATAFFRAGRTR